MTLTATTNSVVLGFLAVFAFGASLKNISRSSAITNTGNMTSASNNIQSPTPSMRMPTPPPPPQSCVTYFHLHIQKAAGTALASALTTSSLVESCRGTNKFRPGACPSRLQPAHCSPKPKKRQPPILQSRLTTGWKCGVHPSLYQIQHCKNLKHVTNNNLRLLTLVRNPVDRIVSEHRHCEQGGKWFYSFDKMPNLTEFVALNGPFRNRQMKMLSGCSDRDTDWEDDVAAQKCLQQAKTNLEDQFFFVGIQEEFDLSLQILNQLMGENMTAPTVKTHDHQTDIVSTYTIDDKTRALIQESEKYDLELYQHALKLFQEKYKKGN